MIDFEAKFREYLKEKTQGLSEEDAEEIAPDLYLKWADTKASWLDGKSPNAYFNEMDSPQLIETLGRYIFSNMTVPGALLCSIVDKSEHTFPMLVSLMKNYNGEKSEILKTTIVHLIEEMEMQRPYDYYIEVVASADNMNSFTEACTEELKGAGAEYLETVICACEQAKNDYVKDCFLDILANMPFDMRTYELVLERFLYCDNKKAFYASLLGKLGCESALPHLKEALLEDNLNYYDYAAIKNAYEALGGEIDIDRDFSDDKDYEALIDWEIKNAGND